MMTKEQRQMVAAHVADTSAPTPWGASVRACLADADRFAATDRARRVGEAVLAALPVGSAVNPQHIDTILDQMAAVEPQSFGAPILRAIAAALRGEP